MSERKLSFQDLLTLIEIDDFRGIIDKDEVLDVVLEHGALPRFIKDVRGALRMAIEREGDGFSVIQYQTELAKESIGEIYPTAANQNNRYYSQAA